MAKDLHAFAIGQWWCRSCPNEAGSGGAASKSTGGEGAGEDDSQHPTWVSPLWSLSLGPRADE